MTELVCSLLNPIILIGLVDILVQAGFLEENCSLEKSLAEVLGRNTP